MDYVRIGSCVAGVAALVFVAPPLSAGPLDPPAGPIGSSYKTLTEVEPRRVVNAANTPGDGNSLFKITQSGSYYLTGNISGVTGKHGIEIAANNVTLDLNGFTLAGVPKVGAFDAVSITLDFALNVHVRNGIVRNWGGDGIDFGSASTQNCSVTGVHAMFNAGVGIYTSRSSTIGACTAYQNSGTGISAGSESVVTQCSASSNVGVGIFLGDGGTMDGCVANNNVGGGISSGAGCTISGCSVSGNTGVGIRAAAGSIVSGCTASNNGSTGIVASGQCLVTGNLCTQNGHSAKGAGIGVNSTGSRVEGNNCVGNYMGIRVAGSHNVIVRNTCGGSASQNWFIDANNIHGPIIDRTSPASPAASGNSAPSSLGSTDANANITY